MSIFKSCDVRGVYGTDLTEEIMADIGRGIVSMMRRRIEKPVMILGGDTRRSTPALKAALANAMAESGADVVDIGFVPTPVLYHAFRTIASDGCTMVTASHNPPKFNGLKLCLSHMPVTEEEMAALRRTVERREFSHGVRGSINSVDTVSDYVGWLKREFPGLRDLSGLKIAVDAGGGTFSRIAPDVLKQLNIEFVPVFCEVDPDLSVRNPNPLPQHLGELCRAVVDNGCDLGAAFDGDGDRVVFVDEKGRVVASDAAGAVLAKWMLAGNHGKKIVYEVNCSQALADAVSETGGVALMEKAGHAFMKRRMIDEAALFGVEVSGHFFYRALGGGDDGLYCALMMCRLLQGCGRRLSVLAHDLPQYYATPVVRLPRSNAEAGAIVDAIAANARDGEVSRLDGVRINYPDGWALARVSVTEPVVSMRFEAKRKEMLPGILEKFLGFDTGLLEEVKTYLKDSPQRTQRNAEGKKSKE